MAMRVEDVLAMPAVQQGIPKVLTGETGLQASVRWVHVAADADVAPLLSGGEFLLTTAAAWPVEHVALIRDVTQLIEAGISGLCIELGKRFTSIPDDLIDLCQYHGVALIALEAETSFVRVTEQVHRAILNEQSEALAARDSVQAMLTTLGLNRAPVDYVIAQLANELNTTVVLENSLGELVSWSSPVGGEDAVAALAHWPRASSHREEGWDAVPVAARDVHWGQLVALPGAPHPAGRHTVLELGAVALALGRLADPFERVDQWMNTNAKRVLDDVLEGRFRSDGEITAQLNAMGVSLVSHQVQAFTIRTDRDLVRVLRALQWAVGDEAKLLVSPALDDRAATVGLIGLPLVNESRAAAFSPSEQFLGARFDEALRKEFGTDDETAAGVKSERVRVTLGLDATTVKELVTSIETALALREADAAFTGEHVTLTVVQAQPLAMLVSELKTDERLTRFAHRVLEPLAEFDRENEGDLVRVLRAYLRYPTNRSQAAKAANLSRSVFYQRLDLIEHVLGADLSNGVTLATLTLALQVAPHLASAT